MRKQYWKVIKDNRSMTFEILGITLDDREFNNMTCKMLEAGMEVNCSTPSANTTSEAVSADYASLGFTEEKGLWARLEREYSQLKRK